MNKNALPLWEILKQKSFGFKIILGQNIALLKAIYKQKEERFRLNLKEKITEYKQSLHATIEYQYALGWQRYYGLKNSYSKGIRNHGAKICLASLFLLLFISLALIPTLQKVLDRYLLEDAHLTLIRDIFLNLGCALIGASAIAFSLIMFAMQINVERMPHGLFRKFSSDAKLLSAFVATFTLAALITGLSLIPDKTWVAATAIISLWCSFLILMLFGFAYRRALDLISPTRQLELLFLDTNKIFKEWDSAVNRSKPLYRHLEKINAEDNQIESKHDLARISYLQLFPNWTNFAEKAIFYCITYSRRYSEQGDHEISGVAISTIISINAAYIVTKGKTFFSTNYLFENPLSTDRFINNTLEHLRQNILIATARKDEQFIEQNLQCFTQLTQLYLKIDYGSEEQNKTHAQLAAGYLTSAVENIVPLDMADVLMEGVSLLGKTALLIIQNDKLGNITSISEKIALIACSGVVNKKYQPVSQIAVMQLARITFELLRSNSINVRFALKEVRNDVKLFAEVFLSSKESSFSNIHSACLGPYYSAISNDSLTSWLTLLVNQLQAKDVSDDDVLRVIRNISEWSDELYRTEKEILLKSIEAKSQFTFHIINWIFNITKLLIAISSFKVCDFHYSEKLSKAALWLISVITWIPDDEETIRYVETFQIHEEFFKAALDAYERNCVFVSLDIRKLLLKWIFMTGKYETGWGTLKRGCCGLACLNIIFKIPEQELILEFNNFLSKKDAPSFEIRSKTSIELREEAEEYREQYDQGIINSVMFSVDQIKLKAMLLKMADHLTPELQKL